jgi:6-pyruvoyltetrahydropterin/6-carboxytetrahydropterin synthase
MPDRYELVIGATFSASHQLRMPDGSVEPPHAHEWRVEVFLEGDALDSAGLLADFTVLRSSLTGITAQMEGVDLNRLPALSGRNPTTEAIAKHVHDRFAPSAPASVRVTQVRVWETPDCAAAFVPSPGG